MKEKARTQSDSELISGIEVGIDDVLGNEAEGRIYISPNHPQAAERTIHLDSHADARKLAYFLLKYADGLCPKCKVFPLHHEKAWHRLSKVKGQGYVCDRCSV